MPIRPEMRPSTLDSNWVAQVKASIEQISSQIERGETVDDLIQEFNRRTRRTYTFADFDEYWERRSLDDFAREAARPMLARSPSVTREDLIEIVRIIQADDLDPDQQYYIELFQANVPNPGAIDLIFWPPDGLEEASPEQVVDAALGGGAIQL